MVELANPTVRTVKRRAREQMRRVQRYESKGVSIASQIGFRAMAATIAAYKSRVVDPLGAFAVQIARALPILAEVKLLAYLEGVRVSQLAARRVGRAIMLETTFDAEKGFLQRSLGVTDEAMAAITTTYVAEAAVVLEVMGARVQRAILETLVETQQAGLHVRGGVSALRKTFEVQGITPAHSASLETIFRTETQKSYAAGRWQFNQQPEIREILWGYRYVTVGDARVRPTHRGLEGVTLEKDHPRWNTIFPPNGYNCRCQVVELFEPPDEQVEPVDRFTTTQNGREVTVTPGADPGFGVNFGKVFVPGGIGDLR